MAVERHLISGLQLTASGELYLGGGGFYVFEIADARAESWMGSELHWQRLGFDCSAFIGHLHKGDACVGAFILPYGRWTDDQPDLVDELDEVLEGSVVDFSALLASFPYEFRSQATLHCREGIIVCPIDDLEVALGEDDAVEFNIQGDLTVVVMSESDDWVDGPVIILRTDLIL